MTDHGTRSGSLQFWPRKRAKKEIVRVNWDYIQDKKESGLLGFVGYKVGMTSVAVKDNTEDSMTKSKEIIVPATILECPRMKIYSVRFYKNKKVVRDLIVGSDKNLVKKLKKNKEVASLDKVDFDYDDLRILVYSDVGSSGSGRKTPVLFEVALTGNKDEKLNFVRGKKDEGFSVSEIFNANELVDVRGVTKGYGFNGPVKRFGISLKDHKAEKGRRRPGSLAPWHPARVTFRAVQAGQTGFHTRVAYNNLILNLGNAEEKAFDKSGGFHRYGKIKTDFLVLKGSIPGAKKRALVVTPALRPTKLKKKQNFEYVGLR